MAQLHVYQKGPKGEWDTKAGDGTGTLSSSAPFDVTMTKVEISIKQGNTYQIRQGTSASGDLYSCLAGATKKNDVARFQKS